MKNILIFSFLIILLNNLSAQTGKTISKEPDKYAKSDSLAKAWYEQTENENNDFIFSNMELSDTLSRAYKMKVYISYFVRARVTGITEREYVDDEAEEPYTHKYPEYKAIALEVFKGVNLKDGDTFSFDADSYMEAFYPGELKVGEELFLPLDHGTNRFEEPVFITSSSVPYYEEGTKFAIKNGVLYDEQNIWGLGNEIPWEKFKQAFLDDVKKIKSYK